MAFECLSAKLTFSLALKSKNNLEMSINSDFETFLARLVLMTQNFPFSYFYINVSAHPAYRIYNFINRTD
jgi:hypothetical protein